MLNTFESKKLSIILPTYNERGNVIEMYSRLKKMIDQLRISYEIIFVDDNSPDRTIEVIRELREKDSNVKYILMSRRFGDQISIMAGLKHVEGEAIIIMDSDLQHPPEYIPQMINNWNKGFDIVIMKRNKVGHRDYFKIITELLFYKFINIISKTEIFYRFSGFALLDKKVVKELTKFKESDPFVRGMISLVGFNKTELYYDEEKRSVGKSKYKFIDMIRLSITGITSFSEKPLYWSLYIGLFSIIFSLIYAIKILIEVLFLENNIVQGWLSTILLVIFFGGVQLFSLGLLGIYIGKIFIETKKRPNYIIAESGGVTNE